jgi:hypothetical protein
MNYFSDAVLNKLLAVDSTGCLVNSEDDTLEFKDRIEWGANKSRMKYIKSIAAISNAGGGYMVFGIEDGTGKPIGVLDTAIVDAADITNALNAYFAPSVLFATQRKTVNGKLLFLIYCKPRKGPPAVSQKDFAGVIQESQVYWRYSGQTSIIRPADLNRLHIELMTGDLQLLEHNKKARRGDIKPEFRFGGGSGDQGDTFTLSLINFSKNVAYIHDITSEDGSASIHQQFKTKRAVNPGEKWHVAGDYVNQNAPTRECRFKIFFTDVDSNLYSQSITKGMSKLEILLPEFVQALD